MNVIVVVVNDWIFFFDDDDEYFSEHRCRDDREVEEYSDVKQLPHKVDSCKHVAWNQRHFGMRKTRSAVGGKLRSMFWLQWKPAGKATLSQDGHCLFVDHCGPRRRWCRRSCRRLFPDRGGCGYCIIADAADEEVVQKKKYPFPPQSVNKFAAEFQAEVPENESKFNFQHVVWKKPKNSTRTVVIFE
ncbi:hypothetical protein T09_4498 [Trichinella sp. T9]|nr:hypothetical protein T09_4498 [Trichinella sp. T9]